MRRCCPETCGTGSFTEEDCALWTYGGGDCIYPNHAQCHDNGSIIRLQYFNTFCFYIQLYPIAKTLSIKQIIEISWDLVPKKPVSGCPQGTNAYGHTCCCRNGCCWDNCRSVDPNTYGDCLKGTGAIWARDSVAGKWRAQIGNFEIN